MAEQYILKVKVDDADIRKLEKRLAGILTGKGITGSGGSGNSTALGKNLAKLGIIATGVVGILALTKKLTGMLVDSSPMLKQMLKLFNFSIMLIFRPIGDFIGFLLRPIMVMFLRKFIVPWYSTAMPVVTKVGTFIGDFVAKLMGEDGIVGMATSLGVIATAVGSGIAITAGSAKIAGRLMNNFIKSGGTAAATSISGAFKFPKPAWITSFQSAISRFVNIIKPTTPYMGTGVSPTANITKGTPSGFKKTGAMGNTGKLGGHGGTPKWIQNIQARTGTSAGAKAPQGRNISGSLKMQPGNLLRGAAGLRGGSGGLAFALAPLLDLVPGMPQFKDMVGDAMRSTGGIDGRGLDEWIKSMGNNNKNTTVNVNIGSIPDKSTADYFLNQLQASTFK
jgi:hypothetical protein